MLMNSSKLFLFSREVHFNSGVRLFLELYCVVVIKHVAFFTIWAKLTVAFTCTSLPLNLYTSVFACGCGFGFEQKILADRRIWRKKGTDRRICIPLFTPFLYIRWHCFTLSSAINNDRLTAFCYPLSILFALTVVKYRGV